jgi:hypothetical protein
MKITRDVITDLLPVYQAGEASQATRDLVEAFLKADPEFAQLIAAQPAVLFAQNQPVLPKELEMKTLETTKKLLWQRSIYFGSALFFSLFAVAFNFDAQGIRWFWAGAPVAAVVCLAVGLLFWVKYAQTNRNLKDSAL